MKRTGVNNLSKVGGGTNIQIKQAHALQYIS